MICGRRERLSLERRRYLAPEGGRPSPSGRSSTGYSTCSGRDASGRPFRGSTGQGRRATEGSSSGSERASSRGYGWSSSRGMTTSKESSGDGSRSTRVRSRRLSGGQNRSQPYGQGQARDEEAHPDRPERDASLGRQHGREHPRHEGNLRHARRRRGGEAVSQAVSQTAPLPGQGV